VFEDDFFSDMPEIPRFDGACKGMPTEWWFPENPTTPQMSINSARAVEICDGCHEKERCLEFAVDNPKIAGIWGGLGWKQRQRIRIMKNRRAAAARLNEEKAKQKKIISTLKGAPVK
jgi:hypothetical protein